MYKYENATKASEIFHELKESSKTKKFLDILKAHHQETYEHSLRVSMLSIDLALENKLPIRIVRCIGRAALLHDYGKSKIDNKILSKEGPLDDSEMSLMDKHPRFGVIELSKHLSPLINKIIISHHEYKTIPNNLKCIEKFESSHPTISGGGKKDSHVNLTQIVAAADMYDALCCPRSYKESFPPERVESLMLEQFSGQRILIRQLVKRHIEQVEHTK